MSRARDIANYGDGIDTSSITSGTLADARIPNLATSKITSGTLDVARIPNLSANKITSDHLAQARFPPGHIIQTVDIRKTDENSAANSSSNLTKVVDGSGNAEWRATINNVTSGNDIIISASFTARSGHTSDQKGVAFGFLRDTGTASNSGGTAIYQFQGGHAIYIDGRNMWGNVITHAHSGGSTGSGELVRYDYINLMYVDPTPGSGTFNYYLGAEVQDTASNVIVRSNTSDNYPFVITLQEIAN